MLESEEDYQCGICGQYDPPDLADRSSSSSCSSGVSVGWVGCDCDRWFHKQCTKLSRFTDRFSCRSVKMKCVKKIKKSSSSASSSAKKNGGRKEATAAAATSRPQVLNQVVPPPPPVAAVPVQTLNQVVPPPAATAAAPVQALNQIVPPPTGGGLNHQDEYEFVLN